MVVTNRVVFGMVEDQGEPCIPQLPTEVWINRAEDQTAVIRTPH